MVSADGRGMVTRTDGQRRSHGSDHPGSMLSRLALAERAGVLVEHADISE
jgi:hypothetical protein